MRMKLFISLSAARKEKDVTKYEWYRFIGKRSVKLYNHHKVFDLDLDENDVFGVRVSKSFVGLIHRESIDIEFKVSFKEFEAMVKRCKGFKGKVNKKAVTAGTRGKDGRTPVKNAGGSSSPAASVVGVVGTGLREVPEITAMIRKLPFVAGIKKTLHVRAERAFGKEVYHFYDVTAALNSYRRKHKLTKPAKGNFAAELEALVEADPSTDIDAEVGIVKYEGSMRMMLACLVVEE